MLTAAIKKFQYVELIRYLYHVRRDVVEFLAFFVQLIFFFLYCTFSTRESIVLLVLHKDPVLDVSDIFRLLHI